MKRFTMGLALLAVLAMCTASLAEVTFTVSETPDFDVPGLESYTVHVYGAMAFRDLAIYTDAGMTSLAGVHQANLTVGNPASPTLWYDSFVMGFEEPNRTVDTRFVPASTDVLIADGSGIESNDGGNQGGLAPHALYKYGLGTFSADASWTFKGAFDEVNGYDILQVVLPEGSASVWLGGTARDELGGMNVDFDPVEIGVPEPSTIALLIAGALGLVVARLRK